MIIPISQSPLKIRIRSLSNKNEKSMSMKRKFLIQHLEYEGCYHAEGISSTYGELWINSVTGERCYIPLDDEIRLTVYCAIFYKLRIGPPLENGYDSDYVVWGTGPYEEQ